MKTSIFAITKLAIKQCFKTCFVWILLAFSILCIAGAMGKGSNPDMVRQIAFCWLPTGILTIFVVGVLWMGCSSIANDIEENRFIGTAVAPVRKGVVWLGRWLGLMLSTALILGVVFVLIGINGLYSCGLERPREQLVLLPEAKEQTIHEIHQHLLAEESKAAGGEFVQTPEQSERTINELRKRLESQYFPLPVASSRVWDYSLNGFDFDEGETIFLEISFLTSYGTTGGANGLVKVYGIPKEKNASVVHLYDYPTTNDVHGKTFFNIPTEHMGDMSALRIVFENASAEAGGATVFINYGESLLAFAPKGTFGINLLYAYLMSLGLLSIVAGIGVTSGMQFSFPVAIFSAFVLMLMVVIASGDTIASYSHYSGHSHGEKQEPSVVTEIIAANAKIISKGVHYTTESYLEEEPFAKWGRNLLIHDKNVFEWVFVSFVILPFIFCLVGSSTLSHKEFK